MTPAEMRERADGLLRERVQSEEAALAYAAAAQSLHATAEICTRLDALIELLERIYKDQSR